VNPDVSVHSEGDTAVKDGGVKTMWLLQYRTYGTVLVKFFKFKTCKWLDDAKELRITSMRCDHNSDDASDVDRHRFDADPDPNVHVDADQIRIGSKMMAIFMRILTQVSHSPCGS
jgi:hypothetical protein